MELLIAAFLLLILGAAHPAVWLIVAALVLCARRIDWHRHLVIIDTTGRAR